MNIILRNTLAYALTVCAAQIAAATPADSTSQDVNELKEIVVEGRRVEQIKDGINIRPTKLEKDASFSGLNLLEVMQPPTLIYNPQDKSFKDHFDNDVVYFINKEPASKNEIDNLPASMIISVQVLQNPADPMFRGGKAVINIIAKEYDYGGYTILSANKTFINNNERGQVFSKFQRKNWILQFDGQVRHSDISGSTTSSSSEYNFIDNGNPIKINRDSYSKITKQSNTLLMGALKSTLRFGEDQRNVFFVVLQGSHSPSGKDYSEGYTDYGDGKKSTTVNHTDRSYTAPGLEMTLAINTKDKKYFGITAGISGSFNKNDFGYKSDFMPEIVTKVDEKVYTPYLNLSFSKRIKKLELYASLNNQYARVFADYTGSTNANTRSTRGQHDLTVNLSHRFSDKVRIGLSATNGLLYYNSDVSKTSVHYHPYYRMYFSWLANDKSSVSVNGGIDRFTPGISELNAVARRTDELLEISGNPDIIPPTNYNLGASYSFYPGSLFDISVTLDWVHTPNVIVNQYSYHDGTVLNRPVNSGIYNKYDMVVTGSLRLFDRKFIISPFIGLCHTNRSGISPGSAWNPTGFITFRYFPIPGLSFALMAFAPTGKYLIDDGFNHNKNWQVRFSAQYKYRNWYFELESDPFTKYRNTTVTKSTNNFYSRSYVHDKDGGKYVQASVRFNFGYGKKMDPVRDFGASIGQSTSVK